MKNRFSSAARITAVLALGLPSVCALAGDCSVKTLNGTYVFTAQGFTIAEGPAQPKALISVNEFHGDGTVAVPVISRSLNGTFVRMAPGETGTYTLDATCTGKITFSAPAFDIFVSPDAKKIWMIQSNTGNVFVGVAESVQSGDPPCSNATLKGAYGIVLTGTRPAPSVPVGMPGFVGQVEQVYGTGIQIFDGNGNFTQVDNVRGSVSGMVPDRQGKGTYTVNPDCSMTLYGNPGPGLQIVSKNVITDGGREIRGHTVSPETFFVSNVSRKVN